MASKSGTGGDSFQFTLDFYSAGTYAIVVEHDGVIETVHPLVVRGYAVSVDAPSEVAPNSTVNVTVDTSRLRGESLETVQVEVANDDSRVSETAEEESDSTYTATIALDDLDSGDYGVYAIVQGSDTAFGREELLGLSDRGSLTIEAAESTTTAAPDTETDGSSGGGPAGGAPAGGGGTDTPGTTTDQTTTAPGTGTTTQTVTVTDTQSTTRALSTSEEETTTEPTDVSNDPTTTDRGVITPIPGTESSTSENTTSSSTDGFGVFVTLIAGMCALGLRRSRQ